MLTNHLDLTDFPDSPYAMELRRGPRPLRFAANLEAEYTLTHLERVHVRVRIWFTVTAVIAILLTIGQVRRTGLTDSFSLAHIGALLPTGLTAWLVWSPFYNRLYLSAGRVLVALSDMLAAIFVAEALVDGRYEQLAALTVLLMALFFCAGLKYRQALPICIATIISFYIAGLLFGAEHTLLLKSLFVITLTGTIGAIVYRDVEQAYRRSFLEGALINELVTRDALSGLMNRRAFDAHLVRVWQQAQRAERSIAVAMIDIDYFKKYNDEFGHQAGDLALRGVSEVLQSFARRPLDLAARYGGEEFALILYDTTIAHLQSLGEQLRQRVQDLQTHKPELLSEITVSVGIGMATPITGRSAQGALQLADEALYEAKCGGRNRAVVKGIEEYLLLVTGSFKARRPRLQ